MERGLSWAWHGWLLVALAGNPPKLCEESVPPGAAQRKHDAEAFSAKSFSKALAEKGLVFAPLSSEPETYADRDRLQGQVVHRDGADFIVGPSTDPMGFDGPLSPFVKDAKGTVYFLEKVGNVVSTETITLCGCGPVGQGARMVEHRALYRLPEKARYGGPIRVEYPSKEVWIVYRERTGDGRPCPQPP